MNEFMKLSESFLYQVDSCYQFMICTEIKFIAQTMNTELRGKLYSYENEELVELGVAEVVIDGTENMVVRLDEKGNYID